MQPFKCSNNTLKTGALKGEEESWAQAKRGYSRGEKKNKFVMSL